MSKVYEEKIVPQRVNRCVKTRKCDLCGIEAKGEEWEAKSFHEVNETEIRIEIRQKEGSNYPDCGMGTCHEIDLCPKCFKERLVPWLKSQGADIKEEEWDWSGEYLQVKGVNAVKKPM